MAVLPITDAGWLLIEGRETPMAVAGLQLFTPPENAPATFGAALYQQLISDADALQPPFDQRLDRPYGRAGLFSWAQDDDVDLEYHVRHSSLPAPGRIRELLALVSRLHSSLLDRHRPLWEVHLIEGLNDGRIAVYTKFHHSMFDGVGAIRQALRSYSTDPKARDLPPPWAITPDEREARTAPERSALESVMRSVTVPAGQAKAAAGAVGALAGQVVARARGKEGEVTPYQAPKSILNGRITGARRFAAQSYAFDRIKQISKSKGATVNDVVMSVCGSALRSYLEGLGELPSDPLIALVPVSIRTEDEGNRGNALSMLLCDLATDEADPVARLQRVKASMDRGKERLSGMSQAERVDYALLLTGPTVLGNLTGTAGRGTPPYNIVISNVPGPKEPLYWNGARMEGLYPVSLLPNGQALNITLTSYVDDIAFGVIACRKTLPHVQRLLDHFEAGLVELED